MQGSSGEGNWIPLVEYASRKSVSLSTLRRHIKANKIKFKFENGRYLLFDDDGTVTSDSSSVPTGVSDGRAKELERELRKAREEIAELKTLLALYEEQMPSGK